MTALILSIMVATMTFNDAQEIQKEFDEEYF